MVTALVLLEVNVTPELLKFEPFDSVAVEVNVSVPPGVMVPLLESLMLHDVIWYPTVIVVLFVIAALEVAVAVMVVVAPEVHDDDDEHAVASPLELMVAMAVVLELQVALTLDAVVPSLFTPVAVNCWVAPKLTNGSDGLMVMDDSVSGTKNPHELSASETSNTATPNGTRCHNFRLRAVFPAKARIAAARRRPSPKREQVRRNESKNRMLVIMGGILSERRDGEA